MKQLEKDTFHPKTTYFLGTSQYPHFFLICSSFHRYFFYTRTDAQKKILTEYGVD